VKVITQKTAILLYTFPFQFSITNSTKRKAMKPVLLSLLIFCFCHVNAQYQFTIEGSAPSVFNNKKIFLLIEDNYSDQKYKITDSITVTNNRFSFKGNISRPSEYAMLSTKAKEIRGFFYLAVDTGINKVVVRPLAPKTMLYNNKLSNCEVLNSASNKIVTAMDSLMNLYYQTKAKPSAKNKYVLQLGEVDFNALKRKQIEVIKSNPNLYYSLVQIFKLLKTAGSISIDEAQEALVALSAELQQSSLGKTMHEYIAIAKSTHLGNIVPAFALQTNKDSTFSSRSLSGKPYILAFGATWCMPCKEKLPFLIALQQKYKSKNLDVVYVNLDGQTDLWKKQIANYKMNKWINVSDGVKWRESEIAKRFNVSAIPFYLVVDRNGKIVYNMYQQKDYNFKQIDDSLKKLEDLVL
jgi:thiol-disulfide isomerase/thioredoxin